jgi:hypothetical protein
MRMKNLILVATAVVSGFSLRSSALAFEGRINAAMSRGNQTDALLYTVGTSFLRVEMAATNWPNAVDIWDRNSGGLTLLFPNNRSFVRLKPAAENSSTLPAGFPQMPDGVPSGMPRMPNMPTPQGSGPTNLPGMPLPPPMPAMPNMPALPPGVGPQTRNIPAIPAIPAMRLPMMPGMMEKMELQATGQKTNLLGFACEKYEIKQRGETMEIWATDQLFPFQPYVQNQPHRFKPRIIEEQWPELVKAKKLFPLLATLKFDNGTERFRFEVQSVTPQKLTEADAQLFEPPSGYFEIQPLPF